MRAAGEQILVAKGADAGRDLGLQIIAKPDVHRADRPEVAGRGIVGPLGVIQAVGDLGHEEVLVGIALAVGVGRPVHRHAVDEAGEIGAVIEVEAAQQVLVGLALAGVHRDHQARHALEQLADAEDRAKLDLLAGDRALAGRLGRAQQVRPRGGDHDFRHGIAARFRLGLGRRLRAGRRGCRSLRQRRAGADDRRGAGEQRCEPAAHQAFSIDVEQSDSLERMPRRSVARMSETPGDRV